MVVFIALIFFMMIRPQKKKEKADREMRANLSVGDEIITIGGVVGKVEKITDKTVVISTGAARNKIEFLKTAVASVSHAEAQKAEKKAEPEAEEELRNTARDKKVTPKKLTKKADSADDSTQSAE
jgi:preprotein translocase subunit YajC